MRVQSQITGGRALLNRIVAVALHGGWPCVSLLLVAGAGGTLAAATTTSGKKQRAVRVAGLYSDLAYNEEGGDLLGMEVLLVAGPGGYYATVQCAGGAPGRPSVVPVQVAGTRVSFALPPGQPDCGTAFTAIVSASGMRGRFAGESATRWLPRKNSYWQ